MDQARFDALARRLAGAAGAAAPVTRRAGVRALAGALLAAGGLAPAAGAKRRKRKDPPVSSTPECVARFNAGEKNLANCDLRGATFVRGRTYEGYDFTNSILSDMDLSYVTFRNCSFQGSPLWRTPFYDATIVDCDFSGAVVAHNADWRKAKITGGVFDQTNFTATDLRGARFSGVHMEEVIFELARLDNLDIAGDSFMRGARFSGSTCRDTAHITGADMTGADLSDAWFMEMVFTRVNLERADLTGVYLSDCRFTESRMMGAVLARLHLRNTSFQSSTLDAATCPQLARVSASICTATLPNGQVCKLDDMCRQAPPAPSS